MTETENNTTLEELEENTEIEQTLEIEELEDGLEPEEETENLSRPNLPLFFVLLFVVAFGIGIGSGYLIWGRASNIVAEASDQVEAAEQPTDLPQVQEQAGQSAEQPPSQEAAEQPQYQIPENIQRYDIEEGDNPVWGPTDAPITIIEFSDYECPFCTKWHTEVWPLIQANYGDQVRLVYRDFPLEQLHSNATPAAAAADCAREQEMYWEYNDLLFSGQYRLNEDTFRTLAEELNLDMDAFNECLDSKRYNAEVQSDLDYAVSVGVQSTPTFFVNGLAVVGAQPYDLFEFIIEKELAGEIP
jgi:protein-disulfide isomerase